MLDLLAKEAERSGAPLTDAERGILELGHGRPVSAELLAKTVKLIELALDHEADIDDPKSLGNSLQWAGEFGYPNVTAIAEEVFRSRGERLPQLRGRRWAIDRIQLVGCGFVAVILIMLFWAAVSFIFHWK
jgi:hypothetical protein